MANRVWKTGHVVIEKSIRDELGIKPGWLAIQRLVDGHVEISFSPPESDESLPGALAPDTDARSPDGDALQLHKAIE